MTLAAFPLAWALAALAITSTAQATVGRAGGDLQAVLKKRANRAGIGVRDDAEGRTVVVLNFGDAS